MGLIGCLKEMLGLGPAKWPERPPSAPPPPPEPDALPKRPRKVASYCFSDEAKAFLAQHVEPLTAATDCNYAVDPPPDEIGAYQIVIFEAIPGAASQLNQLARARKTKSGKNDLLCLIGMRKRYSQYPRGSYSNLLYFCVKGNDFNHREPDLPPEGLPTGEGPTLFSVPDLPAVVRNKLDDLRYAE